MSAPTTCDYFHSLKLQLIMIIINYDHYSDYDVGYIACNWDAPKLKDTDACFCVTQPTVLTLAASLAACDVIWGLECSARNGQEMAKRVVLQSCNNYH